MKKYLIMLGFVILGSTLFAAPKCSIRFMNAGDTNPYYFVLAKDLGDIANTSIIKNPKSIKMLSVSKLYEIEAGNYYICGSYDKKEWGYNNQPTTFEKGKEYFILRIKPGEGYVVIVGDDFK